MFSNISTSQQEKRFRESLNVIPIKNAGVKVLSTSGSGEIEVEVSLKYDGAVKGTLRRLFNLHQTKRYILDTIGKRIYESIDGEKNFEQLIDEFSKREKLTFFESYALLGQYFQILTRRGIIVPMMAKK